MPKCKYHCHIWDQRQRYYYPSSVTFLWDGFLRTCWNIETPFVQNVNILATSDVRVKAIITPLQWYYYDTVSWELVGTLKSFYSKSKRYYYLSSMMELFFYEAMSREHVRILKSSSVARRQSEIAGYPFCQPQSTPGQVAARAAVRIQRSTATIAKSANTTRREVETMFIYKHRFTWWTDMKWSEYIRDWIAASLNKVHKTNPKHELITYHNKFKYLCWFFEIQ